MPSVDSDIASQERHYRRGLVLGFTLAEIMVLILFALLLVWVLGTKSTKDLQTQVDRAKQETRTLREEVVRLTGSPGAAKKFDDLFRSLIVAEGRNKTLQDRVTALEEEDRRFADTLERAGLAAELGEDDWRKLRERLATAVRLMKAIDEAAQKAGFDVSRREAVLRSLPSFMAGSDRDVKAAADLVMAAAKVSQAAGFNEQQQKLLRDALPSIVKIPPERLAAAAALVERMDVAAKQAGFDAAARSALIQQLPELIASTPERLKAASGIVNAIADVAADARFGLDTANREAFLSSVAPLARMWREAQRLGYSPEELRAFEDRVVRELESTRAQLQECLMTKLGNGLEHPACWANPQGKPEYIFDVALQSSSITVHDNAIPHRADDQARLPLAGLRFDEELTNAEFLTATRPLFLESERQQCRFFVQIFDRTAADEKATYKRQLRTVGQHFYYYEEMNLPWGHRAAVQR
jgi:hypothetical protein